MFAHSPFSWKGRSIGNLGMQHHLHFVSLISSCFPHSSKEVPDPVAFLFPAAPEPCCSSSLGGSKPAGKEKHPYESQAERQRGGGSWRGPRSPGELFLGKLQSVLSVPLPTVRVWGLCCQGRSCRRLESTGSHILSCCSAPVGRGKMALLSSDEELSLKAN